jgi:hypothetical protein
MAQLGSATTRHDYGDGRERWDYNHCSALFKEGAGLVAVTLDRGPAILWGCDVFRMSATELCEWLARHQVTAATEGDRFGDIVVSALACGLFAYYFAEGDQTPHAVEVFIGSWNRGQAISL